jgi:hypothetical protein
MPPSLINDIVKGKESKQGMDRIHENGTQFFMALGEE